MLVIATFCRLNWSQKVWMPHTHEQHNFKFIPIRLHTKAAAKSHNIIKVRKKGRKKGFDDITQVAKFTKNLNIWTEERSSSSSSYPWSSLVEGDDQPDWPNRQTCMECMCWLIFLVYTTPYHWDNMSLHLLPPKRHPCVLPFLIAEEENWNRQKTFKGNIESGLLRCFV